MANYEVIVGSTTYDISDLTNYIVEASDGMGMAPLHRLEERGPLQHGSTDTGYRLDPRDFIVNLAAMAASLSDLDSRKAALMRIFAPRSTAIKFRRQLNGGTWRQIDCFYTDGLGMASSEGLGWAQRNAVMLRAPDPTWYDPELVSVQFGLTGGGSGWAIPWAIPWAIGSSDLNQVKTISYGGSFRSYPIIRINGPIDDPVITNETTGEVLDLTGASLGAGDYYVIDCRYGYKTVVDDGGVNQISELSTDSDLATFHLEISSDGSASRNNDIRVAGSNTNLQTEVYFQFYTRYLSVWG